MTYNGVIEQKLRLRERKLQEMETWGVTSVQEIKNSTLLQNALERALQVAVEIMIDVAERMLSLHNSEPQDAAAKTIDQLENLQVIGSAKRYREMVRFRTFIVHRYEYIDQEILYSLYKTKLDDFRRFIHEIRSAMQDSAEDETKSDNSAGAKT